MAEETENRVDKLFQPYLSMIRWYGLQIQTESSRLCFVLGIIYSVLMQFVLMADIGRLLTACLTRNSTMTTEQTVSIVMIFTFETGIRFVNCAMLISLSLFLPRFIHNLKKYDNDFGMSLDFIKVTRVTKMMSALFKLSLLPATISSYGLFRFLIYNWPNSAISLLVSPFHTWKSTFGEVAIIMCSVLHSYLSVSFSTICYSYVFIAFILKKEFLSVDDKINCLVMEQNIETLEETFEIQRRKHENIVQLVSHSNRVFQHVVFTAYAMSIPAICACMYGVLHGSLIFGDFIASLQLLALSLIFMVIVTAVGIPVHSAAHSPLDTLLLLDTEHISNKLRHQVQLFVLRLTGPSLGYDMYGLLVLDKSVVLMLFGTVITYVVVVWQMV